MRERRIERANQFPFPKSIVGKVGLIMGLMTLIAMALAVSAYIMHDSASADTTKTSKLEIPSALLSVSMLRYAGEMNRSMFSFALGEPDSLDSYHYNKNQFDASLGELRRIHGPDSSHLKRIRENYDIFVRKIERGVINEFDPTLEKWAMVEKRTITTVLAPELDQAIQKLYQNNIQDIRLDTHQRRYHYLLLKEEADDMIGLLFYYLSNTSASKSEFAQNESSFYNSLSYLTTNYINEKELAQLKHIQQLSRGLISRIHFVLERYNPNDKETVTNSLQRINDGAYKELEASLTEFSRETSFRAANSMAGLHKILKTNQLTFFALFAVMILSSVALTVYIYKKVTQPIARLADTMLKLSDGNTEIPIHYKDRSDEVGQISHALSSFRDHIISRNQAREQLLYQKERAESASKAKAQFLAAMSHEIRTPMNGVIGMIDILRRSNLNTTQLSVTTTVRESALSLLSIINDILDFSRIEAGKMRLDKVPLSVRNVAEQVMDNLASEANEKNVSLILFVHPNVPCSLLGDPTRIRQILFNLIGNGIKFSGGQPHRGEVYVSIAASRVADDKRALSISIKDNGIGISQDKLQAIFKPFTQAEYSTTRRFWGSGLGLAICQNIATLMGGKIEATSEEGIGSTFTVSFVLSLANDQSAPEISKIESLKAAAQSLQNIVCLNTLENGALKTSIDAYLKELNIPYTDVNLENLHTESFMNESKKHVIICRDYLRTRQLMPPNHAKSANVRYLELNMSLPVRRYGGVDVFAIYASPLKLSMLLSGLRICVGLESPEYPVLDTKGKEDFIERSNCNSGTIFVAEDNVTNQVVIEKQLTYLGYSVVMTSDGQEALRAYRKEAFSLVLTDCHMPNMDGYELTRAIREIQADRGEFVPIVALTANALVGEAERCIETGMNDFIAKPVEIDVIQSVIDKWISQTKPYNTPKVGPDRMVSVYAKPLSEISPQNNAELEPEVLEKLFWGDKETYFDVLEQFNHHCLPELQELSNSSAPFEFEKLKASSHKLKTSSRSIGARTLSDICAEIEQASSEQDNRVGRELIRLSIELTVSINAIEKKQKELKEALAKESASETHQQ
ncbi:ATP-binding protein [Enterovibrio nigricans]|uniref:Sensory/regulatory protein RpfC n=1 Tax=Enterovibrio nigricans DSM 22720 TaxID=1121868 RepID=A0A1T4UL41_9GAMM|nr:ATP-binding protein [Enterovibrio nigricans]PKF49463.1 hybrid sensor histidine kinase/response regulator [Enterovibrio nigricans]SKA53417.1 Signal transduction histidine kinase [Enterovibrio nigricans DSM 22720]